MPCTLKSPGAGPSGASANAGSPPPQAAAVSNADSQNPRIVLCLPTFRAALEYPASRDTPPASLCTLHGGLLPLDVQIDSTSAPGSRPSRGLRLEVERE